MVNLDPKKGKRFLSTVNVKNLHLMEDQLGGEEPFTGLASPKWPQQILGELDTRKVERGRALYNQHCASCHLPPVEDLRAEYTNPESKIWTETNAHGKRFLKLNKYYIEQIGTDPGQALNIYRRVVHASGRTKSAAELVLHQVEVLSVCR